MNAALAAPELRLLAPAFAGRFALIIAGLVALIARAFLLDPRLVPLTVPLYRRLNRITRGIATLMAGFAAGRRAAQRSGAAPRERSHISKPRIPTAEAWLVHTLRHEAAGYASQLSHLLNEPGVPELLAAIPTAGRLLRPLCRMLGVSAVMLPAVAGGRGAPSRTESLDTPSCGVALQATGVFAFKNPESAVALPRTESATLPDTPPPRTPPPCPHVRWPWFTRAQPKPA